MGIGMPHLSMLSERCNPASTLLNALEPYDTVRVNGSPPNIKVGVIAAMGTADEAKGGDTAALIVAVCSTSLTIDGRSSAALKVPLDPAATVTHEVSRGDRGDKGGLSNFCEAT